MDQANGFAPVFDLCIENEKIVFFCNACGDVFGPECDNAEYDEQGVVTDLRIPAEIRDMFNAHWTECSGSYCYIVQYDGQTGMLLVNEFDTEIEDALSFDQIRANAIHLIQTAEIKPFRVFLGKNSGFEECHEIAVFIPHGASRDEICSVMYRLYEDVYADHTAEPINPARIAIGEKYEKYSQSTYRDAVA